MKLLWAVEAGGHEGAYGYTIHSMKLRKSIEAAK